MFPKNSEFLSHEKKHAKLQPIPDHHRVVQDAHQFGNPKVPWGKGIITVDASEIRHPHCTTPVKYILCIIYIYIDGYEYIYIYL